MRSRARKLVVAASLAVLLFAEAAGAQTQEAVAAERFNKGRQLFMGGQYAPALVEFNAASALYESPNTRLYIARCERELGHVAAAYIELERAAREAADRSAADPRYTSTRDVATQEAAALETKLARVKVLAPGGLPDGASITVNGAEVGAAAIGVAAPIDPGPVEVVAKAPGYALEKKSARAAAGEVVEIKIHLEKEAATATETGTKPETGTATKTATESGSETETPPVSGAPSHGLRNAGFVIGGIGIAGMAVFGAFAGLAQTRFDQLKTQCAGPCDASFGPQIDEGQTFQTIANVALAAGGTLLLTGAIMIVAGISTEHKAPPVNAAFAPLTGGGFALGVGGAF
ncbi:MAG TPA: PEGA domain-containing protein [Polyangiaceae bacterium]